MTIESEEETALTAIQSTASPPVVPYSASMPTLAPPAPTLTNSPSLSSREPHSSSLVPPESAGRERTHTGSIRTKVVNAVRLTTKLFTGIEKDEDGISTVSRSPRPDTAAGSNLSPTGSSIRSNHTGEGEKRTLTAEGLKQREGDDNMNKLSKLMRGRGERGGKKSVSEDDGSSTDVDTGSRRGSASLISGPGEHLNVNGEK